MNPLMQAMTGRRDPVGEMSKLAGLMRSLRNGNPEQTAALMIQHNPQFRKFMETNKGKSPEQVAREHGVDFSEIATLFR